MIGVADVGDFEGVAVQIPSSADREIEEGLTVALLAGAPWSPCAGVEYLRPDQERGDLRAPNRGGAVRAPGAKATSSR